MTDTSDTTAAVAGDRAAQLRAADDPHALHLSGLTGVATVRTKPFRKTQIVAAEAAEHGLIAAFTGDPGLGKTFAVDTFVRSQPRPWVWLNMPPRPRPKEVVVRLLARLSGNCDHRAPIYQLSDELLGVLADQPRVIVVDEAQNLSLEGLQQLRYLHDHRDAAWALLFVGGTGCQQRLRSQPELDSRITRRVHFAPLEGSDLLDTLAALHPTLAAADPRVLLRVDEYHCKGVLRRWAAVLEAALSLDPHTTRLTAPLARTALAKLRADQ